MNASSIRRVITPYAKRVHQLVKNAILCDPSIPVNPIIVGLWENSVPSEVRHTIQPIPKERINANTHIPILYDPEFGISSTVIVWNPNTGSGVHYHPHVHCFFTALHPDIYCTRMYRRVIHDQYTYKNMYTWESRQMIPGIYQYIHDTEGPHSMENASDTKAVASFHLYIHDKSLKNHMYMSSETLQNVRC